LLWKWTANPFFETYCKQVVGVHFSAQHIEYAQQNYATNNIHFYCGNALELNQHYELKKYAFTKSTLCFSSQYFESVSLGLLVVEQLKNILQSNGTIFLTDIPDREKWFAYYDSPLKIVRLLKQMLLQKNDMGKFWSIEELDFLAKKCHLNGLKVIQPEVFPYAHYRMDYLLQK
jgi:hypothetical protein